MEEVARMSESLAWYPLSPFGARVDLDLCDEASETTVDDVRTLFDRKHLLFFANQRLSFADQVRVSGWFAPVLDETKQSFVSVDPDVGGLGSGRLAFHSDLSCTPHPLLGLSLHAVEVTDDATSTVFVNAVAAAASLPADLRAAIDGRQVMQLWPLSLSDRQRSSSAPQDWPGAEHPVLLHHPRSGELVLYLNENHTDRIVELDDDVSEALIQQLFSHLYSGAHSYEHRWRNGDFIVWDNIALQHGRPALPLGVSRTLRRVELGAHDYAELMPPQVMAAYGSS
jgi:taurine dioxygenase